MSIPLAAAARPRHQKLRVVRFVVAGCLAASCPTTSAAQEHPLTIPAIDRARAAQLDSVFPSLLAEHGVVTAGIGVLRGGKLVMTRYYGEQSPGVAASRGTLFNVASITKTVAAEAMLRMVAAGKLSLDEPMAPHWVDPDIAGDPRHRKLTLRMALQHQTGFPNWRGGKQLAFEADPGTAFGYSGEGINYMARFAEQKLGRGFDALLREYVIHPLDLSGLSLTTPNGWAASRVALPTDDTNDGKRLTPACNSTGQGCLCASDPRPVCRRWIAADDMLTTVDDYAAFMISVMRGEGLNDRLRAERFRPVGGKRSEGWEIVNCRGVPAGGCPTAEGWGLGWEVVDYGDRQLVTHGGSDWGEVALAYYDTRSLDGMIVFLNGRRPKANAAMAAAIRLIDADSPMAARYDRWAR